MASENRPAAEPLIRRLTESPHSFDFFQAVRRLECAFGAQSRIGDSKRLADDPVRFAQEPSMAFAPSTLASCRLDPESEIPTLAVRFFGLLGPNGPMPLYLTEYVHSRGKSFHDPTMAKFFDVFHHRLISLFYRAWASSRQTVSRDRPDEDRFAAYVGSLIGIGMDSFRGRDSVSDDAKLYYSGRLSCQTRNAEGICAILSDYFAVPVRIDQFVGDWIRLPEEDHCRLGRSAESAALGQTTIIGSRFLDCQQKFRIVLGPLIWEDFQRFLPVGGSCRPLCDWVHNYTGDRLAWDVQLILRADEVPGTELGLQGRLGWTTWMASEPFEHDSHDLILRLGAA